ncbi:DUF6966 domain-containing protein [Luteimonas sp. WGS1318]|uniref:DUF6966 domain-containing protein n=1 Tax=Luteimonas sp. WGS1318 TaxID=3366815 RepID=UPI00372CE9DB
MPDRRPHLEPLQIALRARVEGQCVDADCLWTRHFESCLSHAERLANSAPNQHALDALSGSVMHVVSGMGSFNDDMRWRNGQAIRGMEAPDTASGAVYDAALELRRIDV